MANDPRATVGKCFKVRIEPGVVKFETPPSTSRIKLSNLDSSKILVIVKVTEFDNLRAEPSKLFLNAKESRYINVQMLDFDSDQFFTSHVDPNIVKNKYPMWFVLCFAAVHKYDDDEDHIFAMADATPAEYSRIVPENHWTLHVVDVELPQEIAGLGPADKKKKKAAHQDVTIQSYKAK